MSALRSVRAVGIEGLASELNKYADEHTEAGEEDLAIAASVASERLRDYAVILVESSENAEG